MFFLALFIILYNHCYNISYFDGYDKPLFVNYYFVDPIEISNKNNCFNKTSIIDLSVNMNNRRSFFFHDLDNKILIDTESIAYLDQGVKYWRRVLFYLETKSLIQSIVLKKYGQLFDGVLYRIISDIAGRVNLSFYEFRVKICNLGLYWNSYRRFLKNNILKKRVRFFIFSETLIDEIYLLKNYFNIYNQIYKDYLACALIIFSDIILSDRLVLIYLYGIKKRKIINNQFLRIIHLNSCFFFNPIGFIFLDTRYSLFPFLTLRPVLYSSGPYIHDSLYTIVLLKNITKRSIFSLFLIKNSIYNYIIMKFFFTKKHMKVNKVFLKSIHIINKEWIINHTIQSLFMNKDCVLFEFMK